MLLKNLLVVVLFSLLSIGFVHAQNKNSNLTIHGKVFFKNDSMSVPGAHILIKNTLYGTTSNAEGYFNLHILEENQHDSLVISFVGHKEFAIKVSEAIKCPTNVYLEEHHMLLNSVLVTSLTGEEIIQRAIDNVNENYPKENNVYDVYFKSTFKTGIKHWQYQEISADVVSKGFFVGHGKRDIKVFLKEKKTNLNIDTDYIGTNGIYLLAQSNWARDFLFKKNLKKYRYTINGITTYQGHEVYKIAVETTFKNATAYIYVTTQNYALVSIDYFYKNTSKVVASKKEWSWLKFRFYIDFYEKDDKWYVRSVNDYRKTLERDGKIHEINRAGRILDVKLGSKYNRLHYVAYDVDLSKYPLPYNSRFWKNYNAPPETVEEKRIKMEIKQQE